MSYEIMKLLMIAYVVADSTITAKKCAFNNLSPLNAFKSASLRGVKVVSILLILNIMLIYFNGKEIEVRALLEVVALSLILVLVFGSHGAWKAYEKNHMI